MSTPDLRLIFDAYTEDGFAVPEEFARRIGERQIDDGWPACECTGCCDCADPAICKNDRDEPVCARCLEVCR